MVARGVLVAQVMVATPEELVRCFRGKRVDRVGSLLGTLAGGMFVG